jgi:hypothetical protein
MSLMFFVANSIRIRKVAGNSEILKLTPIRFRSTPAAPLRTREALHVLFHGFGIHRTIGSSKTACTPSVP